MTRDEWLTKNHSCEEQVQRDGGGEYIQGYVEVSHNVTSFPKIYLPKEFQD